YGKPCVGASGCGVKTLRTSQTKNESGWARSKTKIYVPPRRIKCDWCYKTSTDRGMQPRRGVVSKCGVAGCVGRLVFTRPVCSYRWSSWRESSKAIDRESWLIGNGV